MPDPGCPDHEGEPAVGVCLTCGRDVCEACLEDAASPEEFACPSCGAFGAALFDEDDPDPDDAGEGRTAT